MLSDGSSELPSLLRTLGNDEIRESPAELGIAASCYQNRMINSNKYGYYIGWSSCRRRCRCRRRSRRRRRRHVGRLIFPGEQIPCFSCMWVRTSILVARATDMLRIYLNQIGDKL